MSKATEGGDGAPGPATLAAVTYCLVPRDLAPALHEQLRRHFADDPSIRVVVERRAGERRVSGSRRAEELAGEPAAAGDLRRIRSFGGRRVADRRALVVPVSAPQLPRRLARHVDQLVFLERFEPSDERLRDIDSHRLVIRHQSGDVDALSALYLRYFDSVYQYARVALRNSHEAEDAAQQTFMRVVRSLPRYEVRPGVPFRGWVFRIARNVVIDALGKGQRTEPVEPAKLDQRLESEGGTAIEAPLRALEWLSDPELAMFVERLPQLQRQVVALRFMFDLSTDEIATILDRTPKAVRKMQSRALRTLSDRLAALDRGGRSHRAPVRVRMKNLPVLAERRFALAGSSPGLRAALTRH